MKAKATDYTSYDKRYLYAKLEDGTIENLYYAKEDGEFDLHEQRNFYYNQDPEEGDIGWFLDHDRWFREGIAYYHSKIIEFGDTEEELK